MDTLRSICETLGGRDVETILQSGNAIFKVPQRSLSTLGARLELAIEAELGFRPRVITRSTPEMRQAVVQNPFAARKDINPSHLLVTFLADHPAQECREKVIAMRTEPEELHLVGRELYMYFPNGMARPKTSWMTVEKALKVAGTGRNWNVVQKLLETAERLEAGRD